MKNVRTPLQEYMVLKKNLFANFSNDEVWGNYISGKRLGALCYLKEFFEKTEELLEDLDEELVEKNL